MRSPANRTKTVKHFAFWKLTTDVFDSREFNAAVTRSVPGARRCGTDSDGVVPSDDAAENGKKNRLKQQYFSRLRRRARTYRRWVEKRTERDFTDFGLKKNCFNIQRTHRLARVRVNAVVMTASRWKWDEAWEVSRPLAWRTPSHTLCRALEGDWSRWDCSADWLPVCWKLLRKMQLTYFRSKNRRPTNWTCDIEMRREMSLIVKKADKPHIDEPTYAIVMAVSRSTVLNGVCTRSCRKRIVHNIQQLCGESSNNKTQRCDSDGMGRPLATSPDWVVYSRDIGWKRMAARI